MYGTKEPEDAHIKLHAKKKYIYIYNKLD